MSDIEDVPLFDDDDLSHICPICFELIDDNVNLRVRTLSCGHIFHNQCLEEWLNNNNTCPSCRQELSFEEQNSYEYLCACDDNYYCYYSTSIRGCVSMSHLAITIILAGAISQMIYNIYNDVGVFDKNYIIIFVGVCILFVVNLSM